MSPFRRLIFDVAPGFSENLCTFAVAKLRRKKSCNTGIVNRDIERSMEHVHAYVFWFPLGQNE
jgi:hypothetical protein